MPMQFWRVCLCKVIPLLCQRFLNIRGDMWASLRVAAQVEGGPAYHLMYMHSYAEGIICERCMLTCGKTDRMIGMAVTTWVNRTGR